MIYTMGSYIGYDGCRTYLRSGISMDLGSSYSIHSIFWKVCIHCSLNLHLFQITTIRIPLISYQYPLPTYTRQKENKSLRIYSLLYTSLYLCRCCCLTAAPSRASSWATSATSRRRARLPATPPWRPSPRRRDSPGGSTSQPRRIRTWRRQPGS